MKSQMNHIFAAVYSMLKMPRQSLTFLIWMGAVIFFVGVLEAQVIDDPIAYWSFDEAENGLANIVSPGPYHDAKVLHGQPTFGLLPDTTGIAGNALVLNGDSAIRLPQHQDTLGRNFTIAMWYWQQTNDTRQALFQSEYYFNITYEAHYYNYTNNVFDNYIGETSAGSIKTDLKQWIHLVHSFSTSGNNTTLNVYTNGALVLTKTVPSEIIFDQRKIWSIHVGSYRAAGRFFKGMVDELALWNRTLSAPEVAVLYQRGQSGQTLAVTSQSWPRIDLTGKQRLFSMHMDDGVPAGVYHRGWLLSDKVAEPGGITVGLPDTAGRVDDTAGHADGPFHGAATTASRVRMPITERGLGQLTQGDFTLETRFRLTVKNRGVLMGNYSTANRAVNLEMINDNKSNVVRLYIQPLTGGTTVDLVASADPVTTAIWDGNWYHLAGIRRGGDVYLYLNGVQVGTKKDTAGNFTLTGDYYYLNSDTRTGYEVFDGNLQNSRLWTRALETNEVVALAAGALPGGAKVSSANLLAEYASADTPYDAVYAHPGYSIPLVPPLSTVTRGNYTYEACFRTTNAARAIIIGNYSYNSVAAVNLEIRETDTVRFLALPDSYSSVTDLNVAVPYDIHDGAWHHLAGMVRDGTLCLFLDGEEVGTKPYVSGTFDLPGPSLFIGRDGRPDEILNLDGDIRNARLWSRALATNEISALAAGSLPGGDDIAITNLLAEYTSMRPTNSLHTAGFPGSWMLQSTLRGTNTLTMVFEGLPRHREVGIGMLLAQLDSLNSDKDRFSIRVDGQEIMSVGLGYGGNEPLVADLKLFGESADAQLLLNTMIAGGYNMFWCHSNTLNFDEHIYDLAELEALRKIPHTKSTLTLEIIGVQDEMYGYEGFSIDQIELTVPALRGTMLLVL